jgi:hypothetical protein
LIGSDATLSLAKLYFNCKLKKASLKMSKNFAIRKRFLEPVLNQEENIVGQHIEIISISRIYRLAPKLLKLFSFA